MMLAQPNYEDFGIIDGFGKSTTTRESSPSTRSGGSQDGIEDVDARSHASADPLDHADSRPYGSQNVKVKNTFLNIKIGSEVETDMPTLRRRAMSAPPCGALVEEEEVLNFQDLRPPRGNFEVLVGPVKPCTMRFLRTMSDGTPEAVTDLLRHCLSPEASLQVDVCNDDHCTGVANYRGSHELISFIEQLREAFPDLALSLDDVAAERRSGVDAVAIAKVSCTGTQKYPFLPMMPSGRRIDFAIHMETLEKVNGRALRLRWSFSPMNPHFHMVDDITVPVHGVRGDGRLALTDAEEHEKHETESTSVASFQPFFLQPGLPCFIPVFVSVPSPEQSQQPLPPLDASPEMFENPEAAKLWRSAQQAEQQAAALRAQARSAILQSAQQAELAAAALRAQARLERDQNVKRAGRGGKPAQRHDEIKHEPEFVNAPNENERTTIMLRNIPNDLTRVKLLEILDATSFAKRYDFLYLPCDFAKSGNLGYAFVNMLTHQDALRMQSTLTGFCNWGIQTAKKCEAVWSTTQGIHQHIATYRNSRIMHESVPDEFKPVVFRNGERVAFPSPTQKLRPLRQFQATIKLP